MTGVFRTVFLTLPSSDPKQSILKLVGLIILCAIIIAASYFTTRFVGKRQAGITGETNFKSLDIYRINQNKYLQLIQIGTRYFVIAVGKDTVNVLAELNKEDIVYWRDESKKVSFKDIMAKVTSSKSSENENSNTNDEKKQE